MPGCLATPRWATGTLNKCCGLQGAPFPRHSHLQRTVGGIDKAKVLGFRQDHEGTLLMALRKRTESGHMWSRTLTDHWAGAVHPATLSHFPEPALGSTLLQARCRAVFLFSSSTVRSAFPRYSRNSTKGTGQTEAFLQSSSQTTHPPVHRRWDTQRHPLVFCFWRKGFSEAL